MRICRVVVIGGSGFVGSRLCELLSEEGIPFLIVDKERSASFPGQCVVADVRDQFALDRLLPADAVWINLAAEHRDDVMPKTLYAEVNVEGARNICRVAESKGIKRIIFTSSVACYGNAPRGTGEDGDIAPVNDYGRTKYLAEEVFREWQLGDASSRTLAILRPTVIFGERNRGNVYNLLRQIALRQFLMIGTGRNEKSMAYVGNVAAFLRQLIREESGNVLFNYVDGPTMDMNFLVGVVRQELGRSPEVSLRLPVWLGIAIGKMADVVAAATGRRLPVSAVRVKKFVSHSLFTADIESIGFSPPYSMEEALRRTIRYEFLTKDKSGPVFFSE
jgi:nucleoside-diphosphate-sugar epimerase